MRQKLLDWISTSRAERARAPRTLALGGLAALAALAALEQGALHPLWGTAATAAALLLGAEALRGSNSLVGWLEARAPGRARALARVLPWLVLAGLALWSLWPMPAGIMPVNQDHAHHLLATDILMDDFVRQGRLFGWTDRVSGGLPFGDVYPTLSYLITGAAHLLSFGLVSSQTSYAWGLVVVWGVGIAACGLWGRALAEEAGLRFVGVAPLVAGAAYLFDVGADREGGWVYHMFHGVWPQQIGTAMMFLGLLALVGLPDRPTTRQLGAAALLMGVSVWMHPMLAINLATLTPLAILALALVPRPEVRGRLVWAAAAVAAAAVVAMFWFSHLLGAGDVMRSNIARWAMLQEMGQLLWRGQLFENGHVMVGGLALVGVAAVLARGGRRGLLALMSFAALLVFGGLNLVAEFDVGTSAHNRLFMYRRIAITAKPLYLALAGLGACAITSAVAHGARRVDTRRGRLVTGALLVCGSPLVWALGAGLPSLVRGPTARILTAEAAGLDEDVVALERALERHAPEEGMRRVVYWTERGDQGDYALIPIAEAGWGYLPTRRPPAQAFEPINEGRSLEQMARAGATLLVARSKQERPGLELLERFETLYLYRITSPEPATWPVWLEGPGQLEVRQWGPDRQLLEVSGVEESSRLILARPPYDKWVARQGERELTPTTHEARPGYVYMALEELESGKVTLEWRATGLERVSFWLGLLALLATAILLARARELPTWPASELGQRRLASMILGAAMAGLVLGLWALEELGQQGLEREWARRGERVLTALHHTQPRFDYAPKPDCIRPYTRDPHERCVESELSPRLGLGERRKRTVVPSCLRFGVPEKGRATLRWEIPEGTSRVAGRLHGGRVARRLRIELRVGKRAKPIDPDSARFEIRAMGGQALEIELRNPAGRTPNLCVELVALTKAR